MRYLLVAIFGFLSFAAVAAEDIPMDVALLRGLDKVTGRMQSFSVPVGQEATFGKTIVYVEKCMANPPEEMPENAVFLSVYEESLKGEKIDLFKGWMFSSNPALSSMEHPVYDIWVVGCEMAKEGSNPAVKPITLSNEVDVQQEDIILNIVSDD